MVDNQGATTLTANTGDGFPRRFAGRRYPTTGDGYVTPAAAQAPVCGEADCSSLAPASLSASQATLNITSLELENITATATDVRTGRPLVGALVHFYTSDGRLLGSAYTNYGGIAGITVTEDFGPGTIQELLNGYDAVLVGDGVHTAASAHAAITIGTDCSSTPPV
ncbi:hypothetical protein [Streptacidiphilus sp. P02-A3a]|uniref:hypothetical protein n=1 Tax=Streptacidiphilus sp. P02-A3a TaxID=2704468 RepID=UPI0015F92E21|nr:hypothetical protein [Streptacidiphilus sp. P02-A3a]QMU69363.1 hypothetical protein GXP74_15045 [Streptacidiphilus sp. P02-A3a]